MPDALISSILKKIGSIISSRVQQEFLLVVGVEGEVEKLSSNLLAIQAVVEDADRRQITEARVRDWVNKLKAVCYDIDDVLDEWSTAILKHQIEELQETDHDIILKHTAGVKAPEFMSICSFVMSSPCFGFNQVIQRRDIALKIKKVCRTLDVIDKGKARYGFDAYRVIQEPERAITTSLVDVSRVRGRDEDMKNLIKSVCEASQVEGQVLVLSVVGLGGIGKTTLAQLAYNDAEVKAHFQDRIWICVSDPFNQIDIAATIIKAFGGASDPNKDSLESLVQKISELVRGKKFFLVLDDVWCEDYTKWEPLRISLNCGAPGSRILVTTRNSKVAKMMGAARIIHLGKLSKEECWSVFSRVAFNERSKEESEKLTVIGRKIANKAKGLPLAAKTLGGLMQFKRSKEQWESVLSSELWELEGVEKDLFAPLLLSYYDLPAAIRRCFAYCAMFPKGYTMDKDTLIKMWMAQGYLKVTSGKEMELVGEEYFQNLVLRSFFQDVKEKVYGTEFRMHDIVHDFAQFLSKDECFSCVAEGWSEDSYHDKARHASLWSLSTEDIESVSAAKSLRSLFIQGDPHSVVEALPHLISNLTYLRALDLSRSSIDEIPAEVGHLIHLRYLNLNGGRMFVLPDTLCNLCNLQSLCLSNCRNLSRLPRGMQKLVKLRHLIVDHSLEFLPKGIEKLTHLRTLDYLNVSKWSKTEAAQLGELQHLNHLEGELSIWNLGDAADVSEAEKACLKNKKRLTDLGLIFDSVRDEYTHDHAILEALQPPSELESLYIRGYTVTQFPTWISSLTNLTQLQVSDCPRVENWSVLVRLPSLETLTLEQINIKRINNGEVKGEAHPSGTEFPKLKQLRMWDIPKLEEFDIAKVMPQLRNFTIHGCPKMKALPDCILKAPLKKLSIISCCILQERYRKGSGEDWHKISHIPCVII